MSAMRKSLPSLPPLPPEQWYSSPNHPVQTPHSLPPPPPPDDTGRVVFTRQLWQRTMPDGHPSEQAVLNKSHAANSQATHNNAAGSSRRTSSTTSSRSQHHSPTPSHGSKTPLTPEESPPFRSTRKRSAGIVEQEDKAIDQPDISPAHTRNSSGDSSVHVCICQPDPKIPRPRNAFILYRQHHQASVVAQHPGLANPEISKIIGEQWQNQPPEVKNKWKQLAEEEKIRHQQLYPAYRYQPKRNNRRNSLSQDSTTSGEKAKCQKCGGRTILAPSTPYSAVQSNGTSPASIPPTPRSAITPVSRTLPVLKELSLQSPAARRAGKFHPTAPSMPHHHNGLIMDERDDIGPLSPDLKRRKYNNGHPEAPTRNMPPRYGAGPPGAQVGPGTPFPFAPQQSSMPPPPPQHSYSPASAHVRRESLPSLRGVVNAPAPLGPPPRPGMGYQQHRLSQGHIAHDRSLTLPPLQTGVQPNHSPGTATATATASTAGVAKTAEEQIMAISFKYKIKVLCQVAPPAARRAESPRGPLIAVEGDSADAVRELTAWLRETLGKDDGLAVKVMEGPDVGGDGARGGKVEAMMRYHRLAAEWLGKSQSILREVSMAKAKRGSEEDTAMGDASVPGSAKATPAKSGRVIDENYDDSSSSDAGSNKSGHATRRSQQANTADDPHTRQNPTTTTTTEAQPSPNDSMDPDKTPTSTSPSNSNNNNSNNNKKPLLLLLLPLYSLHTSNHFATQIPLGAADPYSPHDHWQWTATQWRGIIGPDLTIYVRDSSPTAGGGSEGAGGGVEFGCVEGRGDVGVIVLRRGSEGVEGGMGIGAEGAVLRRLGFEVGEWVRGFNAVGAKE